MLTNRHILRVAVASLIAFSANAASAQQIAVQQPIIGVTSVSTTVMVPDRGQVHLGGVSSAQSFRQTNGFGLRGSNLACRVRLALFRQRRRSSTCTRWTKPS
ncbi:MAG TPA: hypothetical protein VK137_05290 [Planctomycetaceae bacterium]|nr:hypothetical protein [Planctomycetaceae bacterium]